MNKIQQLDDSINNKFYQVPAKEFSNFSSSNKPQTQISFSKPHEKYITAFFENLHWENGKLKIGNNNFVGNMLFEIECGEVVRFYDNSIILERF